MAKRTWILFSLLCVLSSVDWLLPAASVDGVPTLEEQCLLFFGVGAVAIGFSRRLRFGVREIPLAVAGVGLLGVPSILLTLASAHLPDVVIAAVFALVPTMVVFAATLEDDGSRGLLMSAVLGFAGLLFVLPVNLPVSVEDRLWLAVPLVAALMVAVAGVKIYGMVRELSLTQVAALICIPNAALLLVWCVVSGQFMLHFALFISLSSLVHGAVLVLLLAMLREMAPIRLATRFFIVPLLTVAGGYVLMRPQTSWRMVFGVVLTMVGAGWLLRGAGTGEGSSFSLRE